MKSKELQEMEMEDLEAEPSLDKMVDLKDPKVLKGLGKLAARLRKEDLEAQKEPKKAKN